MSAPEVLKGRYEIRATIGEGVAGIVYRAWDRDLKREIALKILRQTQDDSALENFHRECGVLASLNHPNIIDIYDVGQLEESAGRRPYLVMPLLPGASLDRMIREAPQRLNPEKVAEIINQVCRGLQAAHEKGLVHRDLKPANIFVLGDDAIKIVDFGMSHLVSHQTGVSLTGTISYMAPEQIQMQPPSPLTDIYALGVISFEALTRRRPFTGAHNEELARAILKSSPPPAYELNPAVNTALSQVIHAAMAKNPGHRFSSVREFSETLQKAMRGQFIERFDPAVIDPRLERVEKALAQGQFEFSNEILSELEGEGILHTSIRPLRKRVDQGLREKVTAQLLDSARKRVQEHEYDLALEKVQEILDLDSMHTGALALKAEIAAHRSSEQVQNWYRIAREHLDNQAFAQAREALQNVLKLNASESTALHLIAELDRSEQDYSRVRRDKDERYQHALDLWKRGEVSAALSQIEHVLDLDRQSPEMLAPDKAAAYQDLYNRVRTEHDGLKKDYDEARRHLNNGHFAASSTLCSRWLSKYPDHALFQALKFDIGEKQRQVLSAFIAKVDRQVESEPDLDRKARILEEALSQFPGEPHFERAMRAVTTKRDLVNGIVNRARELEDKLRFQEALGQWDILRNIYPQFPGLEFEYERVQKRRQQQSRVDAKTRWVERIDGALNAGDPATARDQVRAALEEFSGDAELLALDQLAEQALEKSEEAQKLLEEGRRFAGENRFQESIETLDRALATDSRNPAIRSALIDSLLKQASLDLDPNPRAAERLIDRALGLDSHHAKACSLKTLLGDRRKEALVNEHLTRARQLQASGDLNEALAEVLRGLEAVPLEPRLTQLKSTLVRAQSPASAKEPDPMEDKTIDLQSSASTKTDFHSLQKMAQRKGAAEPSSPAQTALPGDATQLLGGGGAAGPAPVPPPPRKPVLPRMGGLEPPPVPEAAATPIPLQSTTASPSTGGNEARRLPKSEGSAVSAPPIQQDVSPPLPASKAAPPVRPTQSVAAPPTPPVKSPAGPLPSVASKAKQTAPAPPKAAAAAGRSGFDKRILIAIGIPAITLVALFFIYQRNQAQVPQPLPEPIPIPAEILPTPPAPVPETPAAPIELAPTPAPQAQQDTQQEAKGAAPVVAKVPLTIQSNTDGAMIVIAGNTVGSIQNGRFQIQLTPGAYPVRVTKSGFSDPGERKINLRRATTESFQLQVTVATLRIVGAPPKAQVLIDGRAAGEANADGAFETSLEPGSHRVGMRMREYDSTDRTSELKAGETIVLAGRELLNKTAAPPGAPKQVAAEQPKPSAPKPPVPAPKPSRPGLVSSGMSDWEGPWKEDKDGWQAIGRDQRSWFKHQAEGSYSFKVQRKKGLSFLGKAKAQWMVNFVDLRNHLLFELDEDSLTCFEVVNGSRKKKGETRVAKDIEEVRLEIGANRITHSVGSQSLVTESPENLLQGRFGFLGPVGIRDFQFRGR